MTTDQKEFIDCAYGDEFFPPAYDRKVAEKKLIVEGELWEYDVKTFKSRIGLITNIGTQLFAMLPEFEKGSDEYNEILNRLKICNCFQSMEIDRAKGIQTMDIPKYWTKWEKINGDETSEELALKELHHKTICEKRPYFFRYLYSEYEKKYQDFFYMYNEHSETDFRKHFKDLLLQKEFTKEEAIMIENFYKRNSLLDSKCSMNKICHHMESKVNSMKEFNKEKTFDFSSILYGKEDFRQKNKLVIESIFKKYRQYKVSINYHSNSSGFKEMMIWLNKQARDIIVSSDEIIYWASQFGSSFILDVFSEDLLEVLKESHKNSATVNVPLFSSDGYLKYMGSNYELVSFEV
jgi:hypothetical protein